MPSPHIHSLALQTQNKAPLPLSVAQVTRWLFLLVYVKQMSKAAVGAGGPLLPGLPDRLWLLPSGYWAPQNTPLPCQQAIQLLSSPDPTSVYAELFTLQVRN